jgi:hypothetical protein
VEDNTPGDTISPTVGKILLWVIILAVVVPVCTGLATSLCGTIVAVLAPFLGMLKH